ncbi:hypothetical protein [Roseibium polysiphoniae]|uniref:AlpA family transcriptional regulator n=1 Tax=Roseibium polysiphoniae TaxID=2571221 RepID=A0ABR9CCZ1_9HYPH|nr:hypothetical protein [Roseibium polysiphoniae]MBD8877766.1 hypothetical protein [Roseibium polysiphoniae]
MPSAKLNLTVQPYRMLSKVDAAHYCGLAVKKFESLSPVAPVAFADGVKRWDVHDLDRWIESQKASDQLDDDALVARLG